MAALLVLHFVVEVTGHHYLYRTLAMTVFKGKMGPSIDEFHQMPNRVVTAADPQPWPLSKRYQHPMFTDAEEAYHQQYGTVSFVVIHRDSLLFEAYYDGFTADSASNSFSMAKSIVSLLCGIAIDRGAIAGVDKEVYWYMPQYEAGLGKNLRIRDLLTMSSGIDFDENYLNPFAFPARANYGDNLELLVDEYHVAEMPGEVFNYQSGTTQVLGLLVSSTMRMPLADMASRFVWQKIGAEHPAYWSLDQPDGVEKAFCCYNATARDFARIGKLYLDHGKWNGEQIVDSSWVAESIQAAGTHMPDGTPCRIYGYQWWLGTHEGLEFFFMRGIKGQYVLCVPSKDLIVVRMGHERNFGARQKEHPDDVYHYLQMGLSMIEE